MTTTASIKLTDSAVAKLKELMAADEGAADQALRVAVTGGGCSGFQYALGFDTDAQDDDIVFEQGGVRLFVDEASAGYLAGAEVDFQDGLSGKGFAINNPNSTGSCGCGQSFASDDGCGSSRVACHELISG